MLFNSHRWKSVEKLLLQTLKKINHWRQKWSLLFLLYWLHVHMWLLLLLTHTHGLDQVIAKANLMSDSEQAMLYNGFMFIFLLYTCSTRISRTTCKFVILTCAWPWMHGHGMTNCYSYMSMPSELHCFGSTGPWRIQRCCSWTCRVPCCCWSSL